MLEPARILVVDDELSIRFLLSEELAQHGYLVAVAASGEEALVMLQESAFDLILLDLKMPGVDGLQVMREAHKLVPDTVVIMLTAHATLDSAIEALRHGGHDYLVKPSSTEEILASVEKGLAKRREWLRQQQLIRQMGKIARQLGDGQMEPTDSDTASEFPARFLRVGGLLLDREKLTVTLKGTALDLTPSEHKLLVCLMENADHTVTFRRLAAAIHGPHTAETRVKDAITTHLWRLRRKLKATGPGGADIVNVRSQGYRLRGQ